MARRKAEIDLLGVASKDELVKFEVAKESDKALQEAVAISNGKPSNVRLVTEEELLRIKKKGEQEILDIQNELKQFKLNEERKISYSIIEEEEDEEVYVPTRVEVIKATLKSPFINLVDNYDRMNRAEKFGYMRSVLLVFLVLVTMTLGVFSVKKYTIQASDQIIIDLVDVGAGQMSTQMVTMNFNDDEYIITKIIIDGQNTVFTFDGAVDFTSKYSATMVDNKLEEYQMDQHYMRNINDANQGKVLALEPLNDGVREFDLIIKENATNEEFVFRFKLNKFLEKSDYIKLYNIAESMGNGINVDGFFSSASGSVLNYSLNSNGLDYKYRILDTQGTSSELYENLSILPSKQNKVEEYDFPEYDITLLQESFSSPKNYESTLKFTTDNIYKSFDLNKTYTRGQIQNGVKIDLGNYSLYLEGLQKRGDTAVLVYHCIDNSFVPEIIVEQPVEENEENRENEEVVEESKNFEMVEHSTNETERVNTILDVEIVTFDRNGNELEVIEPTKINSSSEGTDIVFVDDRLNSVVNNFVVRINSVNIRDAEYDTIIDLSQYTAFEENDYTEDIRTIESAFKTRLGYKASEIARSNIENFSNELLKDKELMKVYTPFNLQSPATYSANVITSAVRDNLIFAIVEEDFIGNTLSGLIHTNVDHRVVYDRNTDEIISDEIINVNQIQ